MFAKVVLALSRLSPAQPARCCLPQPDTSNSLDAFHSVGMLLLFGCLVHQETRTIWVDARTFQSSLCRGLNPAQVDSLCVVLLLRVAAASTNHRLWTLRKDACKSRAVCPPHSVPAHSILTPALDPAQPSLHTASCALKPAHSSLHAHPSL